MKRSRIIKQALTQTTDKGVQSKIHYNIGNSYFEGKQYQESINSYKRALKLDPKDEDATVQSVICFTHAEGTAETTAATTEER
jgi:tetratricopeptide (TPR) repeat protein